MPVFGNVRSSRYNASTEDVTRDVAYLTIGFVNLYFVGPTGQPWMLLDSGMPLSAEATLLAAKHRFGTRAPEGIVLTHGHFDHAGSALQLAKHWNVPIYAHPLELPYLTGKSDYPPQDPTMGGAIAQLSRMFPHSGYNFGGYVRALNDDGSLPLPGWRWIHTPGHTAGHVSLFRDADQVLLAGDAITTMDLDSWSAVAMEARELDRPPAPLTTDWIAARESAQKLAELRPNVIGAGHGVPVTGDRVSEKLIALVGRFPVPSQGRYVAQPARADENGITYLPPPVPDPMGLRLAAAGIATVTGIALARATRRRNR